MPNFITEDDIERTVLDKLHREFGYEVLNCYTADAADLNDRSGRSDKREVILDRLRAAALRLNPSLPESAIDEALQRLTDLRRALSPIAANRELDGLIRDGIPIEFENAQGRKEQERVRVIAFDNRAANEFLAVAQLWIKGERGFRRPDILLYVNGLPLVFIELKNSDVKLRTAFDDNLTTYKKEIPQLFLTNAFCLLSNAIETKVGSCTAGWEHCFNWLRVADEKEKVDRAQVKRAGTSVELALAGLCAPDKLLDYVENFILYYKETQKIIAQNHQFIGVNNAFRAFEQRKRKSGSAGRVLA